MLTIQGLCVARGGAPVLEDIGFPLVPHTFTALLGKNGSGKSTLVSCINQMTPYTGEITFSDRSLALMSPRERARTVAILPQLLPSPALTVGELVAFGRSPYLDLGRRPSDADRHAVDDAIRRVGIEPLRDRPVNQLSGGERQKAFLAMILAQNTRVMVLDEPTAHMDPEYGGTFLSLLTDLKATRKKTLLVVMHDLAQAVRHADRIAVLDQHRLCFYGTTEECLASGVIERIFGVKSHRIYEGGQELVFFS